MNSLSEAARSATVRVSRAVHLATAAPDGELHYDLKEWLIEDVAEGLRWDLADEEEEMLRYYISDAIGWDSWVVEIQTPVPFKFWEGGFGYSWGHYWSGYAIGDTYEEAVRTGIRWAEEQREIERERQASV